MSQLEFPYRTRALLALSVALFALPLVCPCLIWFRVLMRTLQQAFFFRIKLRLRSSFLSLRFIIFPSLRVPQLGQLHASYMFYPRVFVMAPK